eukprot:CAMPEP_0197541658 /NCGR_PEP_ID=MMETSP1318-20131121/67283_1 /TAXON_ID=552666 /ORGANISM="Partenskyella glossopodia, Strain RCC365" /LENGTH=210 /DNA_ID=CAMNT_0043100859 /DNA_START=666 /DNA_END=1298 /DNA_ORIENTATION=-
MASSASSVFSNRQQRDSCAFCFDVLHNHLKAQDLAHKQIPDPDLPNGKFPLFVTWKIFDKKRSYWKLRGCIGTFEPRHLNQGLKDYALISALKDSRFSPISLPELSLLSVNTSFLTDFEDAKDCMDWKVGVHGISISFSVQYKSYSATYLPEVCPEQGWSKEECLDSLIRKAGYQRRIHSKLRSSISLTRYQSVKTSMTYEEYEKLRDER